MPIDPRAALDPEQHLSAAIYEPQYGPSQAATPNDEGVTATLRHDSQDTDAPEFGASNAQDVIPSENLTAGVNTPVFRSSRGATILDASSRRLQSFQKVTPSSR
jgi:hypothetical protein